MPETTFPLNIFRLPKTTCFPFNQEVFAVVIKNWLPLVLGPAFAIAKQPTSVLIFILSKTHMIDYLEVFIIELSSVNRLSACSVHISEIASLNHEIGYNPVENGSLVGHLFAGPAHTPFPRAQRPEVLRSPGNVVSEQTNHYRTLTFIIDVYLESQFVSYYRVLANAQRQQKA